MKKFIRSVSILLALTLVVTAFAACGKKDEAPSSTEPSTENMSMTAPQKDDTVTEGSAQRVSETASKRPTNSDEAFHLFNSLIGSQQLRCTSVQQKIADGTIGVKNADTPTIDFADPKYTSDPNEVKFKESFEQNDKNGVALSAVFTSDISKAAFSGNTLTLTLKEHTITGDMTKSTNSYFNAVDSARVKELVKNVEQGAGVSGVKIKATTHNLSNGKIVAEFNEDFTALTSVNVVFTQKVLAETTFTVFKIDANFTYNVTAEYK